MKSPRTFLVRLALLPLINLQFSACLAQTTAFTYQGRLQDGGLPATGLFDFQFHLYREATNGSVLAGPAIAEDVAVSNGLFTAQMDFGPDAFDGSERWLEIAVRPGASAGAYVVLLPRQQITPTPMSLRAERAGSSDALLGNVAANQISGTLSSNNFAPGSITTAMLADGAVTSTKLATGAVGATQLASNAITAGQLAPGAAAANLAASGLAGVPSGTIVLSDREVNLALLAAGFQPTGLSTVHSNESWTTQPAGPPPTGALDPGRFSHRAIWTGTEVLFIGGTPDSAGLRYNPTANTWSVMNKTNAPAMGEDIHAFWSGTQLIVWDAYNRLGGRYTPGTDTWTAISDTNAPAARAKSCAAFANGYLVVWGGTEPDGYPLLQTGGRYNPANNTWIATSLVGAPLARAQASATAIGTDIIVFGGWGASIQGEVCLPSPPLPPGGCDTGLVRTNFSSGARYNPSANTWSTITAAPDGRFEHSATWSGTYLLVWGGKQDQLYVNSIYSGYPNWSLDVKSYTAPATNGLRYNPNTDSWTMMAVSGSAAGMSGHSAVWSGSSLLVWGGIGWHLVSSPYGTTRPVFNEGRSATGARYSPSTDSWTSLSAVSAEARDLHAAVWTGTQMVFWGGRDDEEAELGDGRRYTLSSDTWTTTATPPASGEPGPRRDPTAVWTGQELIVWGGQNSGTPLRTGGIFRPATGWTNTPDGGAPAARFGHTAVWTGTEMIVWGGYGNGSPLDTGARFNVASNRWFPVSTINAPRRRTQHCAVWTGSEMIVFGGYDRTNLFFPTWLSSAARYQPATDTWQPITNNIFIFPRAASSAVWTGTEMLVWGGYTHSGGLFPTFSYFNTGYRFDPATGLWGTLPSAGLSGRREHAAVWSGNEMLIWGGVGATGATNTGARFHPGSNVWTAITNAGAPASRYDHTAIWADPPGQMIVCGGSNGSFETSGAGQYDPLTDKWSSIASPVLRHLHIAVWTGRNMLVFDGNDGVSDLDSGTAFKPKQTFYYYQKP